MTIPSQVSIAKGWSECPTCCGWGTVREHPGAHTIIGPDTGTSTSDHKGLVSAPCPTCRAHREGVDRERTARERAEAQVKEIKAELASLVDIIDTYDPNRAVQLLLDDLMAERAKRERVEAQVAAFKAALVTVRAEPEQSLMKWSVAWDTLDTALSDAGAAQHDEDVRQGERERIATMVEHEVEPTMTLVRTAAAIRARKTG